MPKFPKTFGRRKSTANALEEFENSPVAEPSFRVFERSDAVSNSFDGGVKLTKLAGRSSTSPIQREDNMFEDIKGFRGSGTSATNTISTTDNASRLSAASTAPSSTDLPSQTETRPTVEKSLPAMPRSSPAFLLKSAGRSFSFGRGKSTPSPTKALDSNKSLPSSPVGEGSQRQRAVTSSSYASTATPPKLDETELGISLGGSFSDMFSSFDKRSSAILDAQSNRTYSESPESNASELATSRLYMANRANQPSPLHLDGTKDVEASPYSWGSQASQDGLMSNSSPAPSPYFDPPPPVPHHDSPLSSINDRGSPSFTRPQRPGVLADNKLRRSVGLASKRRSTLDYGDAVDEDARLLRDSVNAERRLADDSFKQTRARDSWINPSSISSYSRDTTGFPNNKDEKRSLSSTARKPLQQDNMFDHQIAEAAILANQYNQRSISPPKGNSPKNKVMTPAQFEKYRQEREQSRTFGGKSTEEADDDDEDTYDDDEDEAEKQRELAKQRRRQEAHMAVYRQQMMKVTGEAPADLSRASMVASQSTPNLNIYNHGIEDGEEEDEEIPLAILAAHGFPSRNKPPGRLSSMMSNPALRAASQLGAYPAPTQSVNGDSGAAPQGGRLPVFARNLPQDPYFGAGLVNPSNRESLALGSGSGPSNGPQAGGLVGVIATEERSRAMRRGSPNAAGIYGPPPSNGFDGQGMTAHMQMPQIPQMPMNGMNGLGPITPGDQAQFEMAQQMQQFMQMQMQFMQLMTAGPGPSGGQPQQPMPLPRSSTMGSLQQQVRPLSSHQRAMSSLDPNAAPWQQGIARQSVYTPSPNGNGYAPSIAPSERSNVGMPGRYRPVSQFGTVDKSRTNTMSGALQDWSDNKNNTATVKVVPRADAADEDDEEGWEAMTAKREKKKSAWKSKKDLNGISEMAHYTN